MNTSVTLLKWPLHQPGHILDIAGDSQLKQRLVEMGLVRGVQIETLARVPFGGPLIVRVGSATLAMRRREAECVIVQTLP